MATPPTARQPIDTRSANAVATWIDERIKAGSLKRCANLGIIFLDWIDPNEYPNRETRDRRVFAPYCEKHSFDWIYKGLSESQQNVLLEQSLDQNPIACPANCRYYRNARWAAVNRHLKRWGSFAALPFRWFGKAAWQTQVSIIVAIALIVILWRFPQWLPPVIDLVKAVRGH